jgi:hypothetical protein
MLLNRDFKRLGDIAGGTVVVYRDPATSPAIPMAPPLPQLALSLPEQRVTRFATRAGNLAERAEELASLAPPLTGGQQGAGAEALARLCPSLIQSTLTKTQG